MYGTCVKEFDDSYYLFIYFFLSPFWENGERERNYMFLKEFDDPYSKILKLWILEFSSLVLASTVLNLLNLHVSKGYNASMR